MTCQQCLAIPLPWDRERADATEARIMEKVREALADGDTMAVNVAITKAAPATKVPLTITFDPTGTDRDA